VLTHTNIQTYLSFSKHYVCVWCRVLIHIRFVDNKQYIFWLANCDSTHTLHL